MARRVSLPFSRDERCALRAGEELLVSGPAFTVRDATCLRLLEEARAERRLPFGLAGQLLCFIGPTPPVAGRPHGAAGPTTARRMDRATVELARFGLAATFGKGERSEEVRRACREHEMLYLIGIGGAAALAAQHIVASEVIAWPELGPEALRRIELDDFPAWVAYDTCGGDLYREGPAAHRARYHGAPPAQRQAPAATTARQQEPADV